MWKQGIFRNLAIAFCVFMLINVLFPPSGEEKGQEKDKLTFSGLTKMVSNDPEQIKNLTFLNGKSQVVVEFSGKNKKPTAVEIPDDGGKQFLIKIASEQHVVIDAKEVKKEGPSGLDYFLGLLFQLLPIVLLVGAMIYLSRNAQMGMNKQLGQSKAKLVEATSTKKTFADVAGCVEAKQELMEVVEYLRNPGLLAHLGGRAPRGVLLIGPPGNGKTLLAKATAGEAGATFFAISASQFVEMFVGVGAARVRDLFEQARSHKPSIVFIDEIDAVGRQRGAGIGGGHDEREQTLNQLLVEMDGFEDGNGLILMAATNRPDILDPALIRPGRFDRQVLVDHADVNGREAIFRIHMRNKKTAVDVDTSELARLTPGLSGAEIEGVCNEAATVAARRIKESVSSRLAATGKFSELALRTITDVLLIRAVNPTVGGGEECLEASQSDKLPANPHSSGTETGGSSGPRLTQGAEEAKPTDGSADLRQNTVPDLSVAGLIRTQLRRRATFSEQEIAAIVCEQNESSQVVEEAESAIGTIELNRADFVEGIDRIQMGVARTSRAKSMSREDMENTSIHELGHALIMTLLAGGDPVTKITIMPRGGALGVTQSLPASDRYGYTRRQLLVRILMAMGGRAAQEEILDTVDTGAQNDFKQAWSIAHRMVSEFGMSRLGPIFASDDSSSPFLGRSMATPGSLGSDLSNDIDSEVRCLTNSCLDKARELIRQNRDFMEAANQVLLAKETLLADEWAALLAQHGIAPNQLKVDINLKAVGATALLLCQTDSDNKPQG